MAPVLAEPAAARAQAGLLGRAFRVVAGAELRTVGVSADAAAAVLSAHVAQSQAVAAPWGALGFKMVSVIDRGALGFKMGGSLPPDNETTVGQLTGRHVLVRPPIYQAGTRARRELTVRAQRKYTAVKNPAPDPAACPVDPSQPLLDHVFRTKADVSGQYLGSPPARGREASARERDHQHERVCNRAAVGSLSANRIDLTPCKYQTGECNSLPCPTDPKNVRQPNKCVGAHSADDCPGSSRRARRRRASLRRASPTTGRRHRSHSWAIRSIGLWGSACLRRPRRCNIIIPPPSGIQMMDAPPYVGEAASGAQCPAAAGQAPPDEDDAADGAAAEAADDAAVVDSADDDAAADEESGPEVENEELAAIRRGRRPEPRGRRRSGSLSRPRRQAQAGAAAAGARGAEEREEDLTRHLPLWKIAVLSSERQEAELRQVVRRADRQRHFVDNRKAWQKQQAQARAASGAQPWIMEERREEWYYGRVFRNSLSEFREPIPDLRSFVAGIAHWNSGTHAEGQWWDVVRAPASKKVRYYYRGRLQEAFGWGSYYRGGCVVSSDAPFCEACPNNAVLDDGWAALTPAAFRAALDAADIIPDEEDGYVKNILDKRDGEVRAWGVPTWRDVSSDSVEMLRHRRFCWHDQFARQPEVRQWLHAANTREEWSSRDQLLSWRDIEWVMHDEEGGETAILKRDPASASGERKWHIKAGQHITLAEMFSHGCEMCSCHFLYARYLQQTIIITKRKHSESISLESEKLRNAKDVHWKGHGTQGAPVAPTHGVHHREGAPAFGSAQRGRNRVTEACSRKGSPQLPLALASAWNRVRARPGY